SSVSVSRSPFRSNERRTSRRTSSRRSPTSSPSSRSSGSSVGPSRPRPLAARTSSSERARHEREGRLGLRSRAPRPRRARGRGLRSALLQRSAPHGHSDRGPARLRVRPRLSRPQPSGTDRAPAHAGAERQPGLSGPRAGPRDRRVPPGADGSPGAGSLRRTGPRLRIRPTGQHRYNPRLVFEIGNSLREARLRQGLEIPRIEADTKIRGKYLRALEEEQFEVLPGDTYVKGFLRTYADYLGLDGQLYMDEYNSRFAMAEEIAV